jgi:uncharacterized membrane protein
MKSMQMRSGQTGFTLIELLIVSGHHRHSGGHRRAGVPELHTKARAANAPGELNALSVTAAGVITASWDGTFGGVANPTVILTPTIQNTLAVTWATTGTCQGIGLC